MPQQNLVIFGITPLKLTDHPILDGNLKILDTCDPFDLRLLESNNDYLHSHCDYLHFDYLHSHCDYLHCEYLHSQEKTFLE